MKVAKLNRELDRIQSLIPRSALSATAVSAAPVGWHLDHALRVVLAVSRAAAASDPADYRRSFHPLRTLLLLAGRFPRGIAKTPRVVDSPPGVTQEEIHARLGEARTILATLPRLAAHQHFDHFAMGLLDRDQTVAFLLMHTRHHLRIVNDILRTRP